MPKLSRPALLISACIFLCALVMLCVAQLSAVRVSPADLGGQAAVTATVTAEAGTALADAGGDPGQPDSSPLLLADLSSDVSELAEPLAPVPAVLLPAVRAAQPAAPLRVALPHPLIEGPQRPPRTLQA